MAGRITKDSIERVRQNARLDEVVSQYVQLTPAGVDSFKGLCPFHDEKTPSFHVRPANGYYKCFGCGKGGDVITFVQDVEHLSFVEAVELLAGRSGTTLEYEEGGPAREESGPTKLRLIDAHRVAVAFYEEHLRSAEGTAGIKLLRERGFDDAAIARYHLGYSPNAWDSLYSHLRSHGFSDEEVTASGLATRGTRGVYDRFRGRLMWPIYSITGDPIGFGARKIADDSDGPKYLNTPETPIYHKSRVLYGLDLAKKAIAEHRKVAVVEGYTDVMAAHLAGIEYAVATCGTAFGEDHIRIVRRLLGDSQNPAAGVMLRSGRAYGGEVIFTFDGDEAGRKAALRAFSEDQSFAAQTFVAVASEGKDPCELRMSGGDQAVRDLIASRRPLFEFAIRSVLADIPLATAEGRSAGLRAAAPIVASIRDRVLRGEYTRQLAGWLGMDETPVREAVQEAKRRGPALSQPRAATPATSEEAPAVPDIVPLAQLRDPIERLEREALGIFLQLPEQAANTQYDQLPSSTFLVPLHQRIHEAIRSVGGTSCYTSLRAELDESADASTAHSAAASQYVQRIVEAAGPALAGAITQIAVEPLPERREDKLQRYADSVCASLISQGITRQIADVRSRMQREGGNDGEHQALFKRLLELEEQKRQWDSYLTS